MEKKNPSNESKKELNYYRMHNNKTITRNLPQESAINHGSGPALVLAGPGSGKTFVLTHRIKNLIESYHINPEQILVITFTKAASLEMKERFFQLMRSVNSDTVFTAVTFGTFHAVFYHILQYTYQFTVQNILTEKEKYEFLQDSLQENATKEYLEMLLSEISNVKNFGIPIQEYEAKTFPIQEFREVYQAYQQKLRANRKLDFDDMVDMCYELLKNNEEARHFWSGRYSYLLIDEFQDINDRQYQTIRLLASPGNHIFAVGDDDQSIYGFRGSNPKILKQFCEDFNNIKRILLNVNYRCSGTIVNASLKVIAENKNRFEKEIRSNQEQGEGIVICKFSSEDEQTENIIQFIRQYAERKKEDACKNRSYQDIAVIYRTNAGAGYLAEQLVSQQIPFRIREKITCIYSHFIAKDLISYMKFGKTYHRAEFFQIMNKPARYLSRKACESHTVDFQSIQQYYREKPYMKERIRKFAYDIQLLQQMQPFAAINYIRKGIGYEAYLVKYAKEKGVDAKEWLEILAELQRRAASFETIAQWLTHVEDTEAALQRKVVEKTEEKEEDAVSIITMHSCKGLEFEVVIIPDINEKIIPHKKAESKEEIEEERRLFYVAMTRAKQRLLLFYQEAKGMDKVKSRFLKPLL